jgi:hypothetical protein
MDSPSLLFDHLRRPLWPVSHAANQRLIPRGTNCQRSRPAVRQSLQVAPTGGVDKLTK